ncbi:MAG: DUF1292 domain-containing protein [Clostridiales bacterium]|nr:DUF1292 domain-containing protein [Clostridiales bacterium]
MENNEGIITLEGENGELVDMLVIEMVEFHGRKYVLLQSADETDEDSYIFKFSEEIDFDKLETISDEKELTEVFNIFDEKISGSGHVN